MNGSPEGRAALPRDDVAALARRHAEVQLRIEAACRRGGRPAGSVRLLAVSKTFGADRVLALLAAGQRAFGEN